MKLEVITKKPEGEAKATRGHAGSEGHEGLRWHSIADYVSDVEQVAGQFETPPIIGAVDDTIIPIRVVEATARIYGTRAEIFPGIAHDMMLEAGWEKVAKRILGWLEERGL